MNIYFASKSCESSNEQLRYLDAKDRHIKFDPNKLTDILQEKNTFLIDVFHTFIEPTATYDDQRTFERFGPVAFAKTRIPRLGFKEFLKHYHGLEKKIAIHSDSFYKEEFIEMDKHWNFDSLVDKYFDRLYMYEAKPVGENKKLWMKNFGKMIKELDASKKDSLIITDGRRDIVAAKKSNIDILLVPDYYTDTHFDYTKLISKI